ncbi:MAG: alpha-1,6-glucosidase domain-containing protein, partial [Tangfeifania sp.]
REEAVKFGVVGAVRHPEIVYEYVESSKQPWAGAPGQCVNYASCHDNFTLWDKLKSSCPKATDEEMRKMMKLSGALVITSQGIPFLHAGVEFCRTKGGHGNSYKSPDSVNQIDWSRKEEFEDVFTYYKNLIEMRKNHPAFRMSQTDQVQNNIKFCTQYKIGVVAYCIDGRAMNDSWKDIILIFNGSRKDAVIPLPEGNYTTMVNGDDFHSGGQGEIVSGEIKANPVSMTILVKKES